MHHHITKHQTPGTNSRAPAVHQLQVEANLREQPAASKHCSVVLEHLSSAPTPKHCRVANHPLVVNCVSVVPPRSVPKMLVCLTLCALTEYLVPRCNPESVVHPP
jgi:hypothetical protein